jgi:hypothetical protein
MSDRLAENVLSGYVENVVTVMYASSTGRAEKI